jgi:hypothetical protein
MKKIYELRDELMNAKKVGINRFTVSKSGKWLEIDDLIKEIDGLRVCECPPVENNG